MRNLLLAIVMSLYVSAVAVGQPRTVHINSPNGDIKYTLTLQDGKAVYSVSYKDKPIINKSELSLTLASGGFEKVRINKPLYREATEDYDLVVGKTKHVHDRYNEVTIPLQQAAAGLRLLNLQVRVFDDGIGFRYGFPAQPHLDSLIIMDEHSSFNLVGNPMVHTLFRENYTTSHEGLYSHLLLTEVPRDMLMDMPSLFVLENGLYVAITEAALLDYAGMYLSNKGGILTSKLSPLPGQAGVKVRASLPHNSPWRVLLISDRVGTLIESNIVTSLNEPNKIKDTGWIKPGKSSWTWWNGNISPDTSFAPGNNFDFNKYYIDFCANNKIEYHSVIEYGTREWYVNEDGNGFEPGPGADVTKPVKGLDMKAICDYAKSKGVGIRVWVHWAALFPQPKMDSAFTVFERWGVKGMMIDFMDRDDQQMVNMQTQMLEAAAAHHLHIQFHGAYKPTGLSRTYPNEFTREGTLNYEADKWTPGGLNADHDINIPFTRMLAGPTDYHLGGFRAVPASKFKVQFTRPMVLSTRCHMLAMYVILESYLSLVSDYPDAYTGQPGFEFIKEVPTTWDETRVLNAKVNEFLTIARRKNNDWYVGTITNHEGRLITIPLSFLGKGKYQAELYSDANNSDENPNRLLREIKILSGTDTVTVKLAASGGQVIHFRAQ